MILGALDTSYLARKQARDERKRKAKTITSEILLALVSLVELEEEEYLIDEQQEADNLPDEEEDELEPERKKKKSEFVPLMVPRDILNNSGVVQPQLQALHGLKEGVGVSGHEVRG